MTLNPGATNSRKWTFHEHTNVHNLGMDIITISDNVNVNINSLSFIGDVKWKIPIRGSKWISVFLFGFCKKIKFLVFGFVRWFVMDWIKLWYNADKYVVVCVCVYRAMILSWQYHYHVYGGFSLSIQTNALWKSMNLWHSFFTWSTNVGKKTFE